MSRSAAHAADPQEEIIEEEPILAQQQQREEAAGYPPEYDGQYEVRDEDQDGEGEEGGFEFPGMGPFGFGEASMLGQTLVTEDGESVADILSDIRDILDKGVKVLFKLNTTLENKQAAAPPKKSAAAPKKA